MNWVILYIRTGSEDKLVQTLKEKLTANGFLPFVPTKEMPFRSKGVISKVRQILFPGYVFLQTEVESERIMDKLEYLLRDTHHIYSVLHYGDDKKDVVIRENELKYWGRLFDSSFCILGSIGYKDGDVIKITSGSLKGLEGQIKKIDRHQRKAIVEMEIMGRICEVVLMLEVAHGCK